MSGQTILVVDDEPSIVEIVTLYLQRAGYTVRSAADGHAALRALTAEKPDLVVLDLMLPGVDGLEITRRLRAEGETPIIMLTSRSEETDRIVGLEMGADDYVSKPFNPRELLARVRAVLRRTAGLQPAPADGARQIYRFSGWRVDVTAREVVAPSGSRIAMTAAEFDLLYALCEHPNRVLTRDQLIGLTHGPVEGPHERSIDTLISRLRQKMETDVGSPRLIQTVRSEGYMFTAQVSRR